MLVSVGSRYLVPYGASTYRRAFGSRLVLLPTSGLSQTRVNAHNAM